MFWESMVSRDWGILDGTREAWGVCEKNVCRLLQDSASAVILCFPSMCEAKKKKKNYGVMQRIPGVLLSASGDSLCRTRNSLRVLLKLLSAWKWIIFPVYWFPLIAAEMTFPSCADASVGGSTWSETIYPHSKFHIPMILKCLKLIWCLQIVFLSPTALICHSRWRCHHKMSAMVGGSDAHGDWVECWFFEL